MTDTQRWRRIAEQCEKPCFIERHGFLCNMWEQFGGRRFLLRGSALGEAVQQSGGFIAIRPFPSHSEGREVRATFAALMAAMTKRERAEIGMP